MAIDPSIALSANAGSGNLLQTLAGATQLRGVQQQQQANIAASQAYKAATAPDGTIDYGKLTAALSQGPAAYNLPQIQAQVNEARNSALNYDKGKLEMAQKRTDLLSGGFGGLLASGNITPQAVMQIASQGIRQGLFTPEDAVSFTSDMPSDPSQLQAWAKQKYVGFSTDADRLKTLMPQQQTINTGAQQVVSAFDPLTGAPTGQNTVFNNQMSPEAASQPTQVFDPASGTMRNVTRQQFADMAGGVPANPGMAGGAAQGMGGGALGTGRLQPITQAPGLQAAPALGAQEAAQTIGKGAAEASLALQSQADAAPQAIYQLQNMRSALADINTGPNADWQGKAKALALQVAPDVATKLGLDPQKVASQEEFKKYSTQLAQGLAQGLGTGTDEKLASAVSANPNISLSKLGNQQIIDVLIATQRGTQAKNIAWQNSGLPPEKYNQFSTQFNKDIDPRVFAAQDMDQAARYKMLDSLPKRDQEAFKQSWLKARAAGYVQ
jgi:hypothetical protein